MPSTSPAQRSLMGMALAYKRGTLKPEYASAEVKRLAASMTEQQLRDFAVTKNEDMLAVKKEAAAAEPPRTGPEAILEALRRMDVEKIEQDVIARARSGKSMAARKEALQTLAAVRGLKRNNVRPEELMITRLPVMPAQFRPYSAMGDTFIPGDANETLADLFLVRDAYQAAEQQFGPKNAGRHYMDLYGAVRAVVGLGSPVRPKTAARGVSGLMQTITGTSPKWSWLQRKMISKPVDSVGRGVIIADPDLGIDEIGMPKEMGFESYKPHIQRRLVRGGMSPSEALKHVAEKTPQAWKALEQEARVRPVQYSRAPAWHRFNYVGGWPKFTDGSVISVNPFVTAGLGADHDGDTMNVHVPVLPDTVEETINKLMPSRMLFSIKDPDKVMPAPKHEALLGLNMADTRPSGVVHKFGSEKEALDAIRAGRVDANDDVEYP